jgi:intracellular multiplication protein IcmC
MEEVTINTNSKQHMQKVKTLFGIALTICVLISSSISYAGGAIADTFTGAFDTVRNIGSNLLAGNVGGAAAAGMGGALNLAGNLSSLSPLNQIPGVGSLAGMLPNGGFSSITALLGNVSRPAGTTGGSLGTTGPTSTAVSDSFSTIKSSNSKTSVTTIGLGAATGGAISTAGFSMGSTADASTMLENFSKVVPALMRLVTAIGYVMGFYFIIKAILELKQYGESRSAMSKENSLRGPMIFLFVGAAMIYLPSTVIASLNTFWANPSPYAYADQSASAWYSVIKAAYLVSELVGTIAFIRGLIMLTHIGGGQSQSGTFGKAMTHIVAGVLCINMYGFVNTIWNTLSIS